jgi:CHAT domain-containing protein
MTPALHGSLRALLPLLWAVLLSILVVSSSHSKSDPPSNAQVWDNIRTLTETLKANPGRTPTEPLPYSDIMRPLVMRLNEALEARAEGRESDAAQALEDCRMAAGLISDLYSTDFFTRYVDWAANLSGDRLRKRVEAETIYRSGYAESRTGNWAFTDSTFRQALPIFEKIGDARRVLTLPHMLLISPTNDLEEDAKLDAFRTEARRLSEAGLRGVLADNLWQQARLHAVVGRYDSAYALYDSVRALAEKIRHPMFQWRGWEGMAWILNQWSQLEEARDAFWQCVPYAEVHSDTASLARMYANIGHTFYESGWMDSSAYYQRLSIDLSESLGDVKRVSDRAYSLCLAHWYMGDDEEALLYCERARDASRESDNWWVEENAENILGNIFSSHGDCGRAIPCYGRAMDIALRHDDSRMQCYALQNVGSCKVQAGSLEVARDYLHRSLAAFDSIPPEQQDDWDLKGTALVLLSWIDELEGNTAEAIGLARDALTYARDAKHGDVGVCFAGGHLSRLLLDAGDLDGADSLYQQVTKAAERRGNKAALAEAHTGLAEIAWRRGDRERAIAELRRAIEQIEAQREALGSLDVREDWFASRLWAFERMIRHQIETGNTDEAFAYYERMRARALLDILSGEHAVPSQEMTEDERAEEERLVARIRQLGQRSKQGALDLDDDLEAARAEYAAFEEALFRRHPDLRERRGRGEPITAREACGILDDDEIALLYTMGSDDITMLAVTRDGIRGHILEGEADSVRRQVERLTDMVREGRGSSYKVPAQGLFQMLVSPAQDLVTDKRRVCFVPDAELWAVPLQILIDPESGSHLVEMYSIHVVPSLSTLGWMRSTPPSTTEGLLAFGDAYFGEGVPLQVAFRGSLSPLPFSADEVTRISDLYMPEAKVLTGREATEDRFRSLAGEYGVIHLASHGIMDDTDPLYSGIAFARGEADDDGFLEAWEVMRMELDADLVVLSACETAGGTITRGEGINGLMRSFFVAGVPTVVASLWPVEDESTSILMREFHQQLRDGEHPADALAMAERKLLHGESRFRHPFSWAGFLLYGDSK